MTMMTFGLIPIAQSTIAPRFPLLPPMKTQSGIGSGPSSDTFFRSSGAWKLSVAKQVGAMPRTIRMLSTLNW